ncbi:hypothetical protein GOZ96_12320 [Agrobacterium vitis]|nr:hypothetical protein [Agrobacterium vitis]MUZ97387.1 hypothetical protein [Agrobacterium vitis]NOJ36235.1 hypothetical protein [Agrobacterium vitis]
MVPPTPNVSFSKFLDEMQRLYKKLPVGEQKKFKRAIYQYFKRAEPEKGWQSLIEKVIGKSATVINWSVKNDLTELSRGAGDTERAIARYYYLHSLTYDLSFAHAVDAIIFKKDPRGKTYEAVKTISVFQPQYAPVEKIDDTWKSSIHSWELSCQPNKPANLRLASLAIEATQSANTHEPLALIASVHIMPAYEVETGIELRFRSVDIVIECADQSPASDVRYLEPSQWSAACRNAKFSQAGTSTAPYVTLSNEDDAGLEGQYNSDTLFCFHPNQRAAKFEAELGASVISTNAIFPEDMNLSSRMKAEIIKRMLAKAVLPEPDETGHISLHKLKYDVCAVERAFR